MPQMDEVELKSIISSLVNDARDFSQDSEIAGRQEKAIKYFLGESFRGRLAPEKGRSSIIAREVHDTIEWQLPQLLRPFTSSDRVVEFIPQNEEDEEPAQQETDVVNYVFSKQNRGFNILYTYFKDALFPKGGYVKTVWEDLDKETTETYKRLSDEEFEELDNDPELELEDHTVNEEDEREINGVTFTVRSHAATFRSKKSFGQVRVFNVPPEEVMVDSSTTWDKIKETKLIAHVRSEITATELLEMFPDKKSIIDNLSPTSSIFTDDNAEELARDRNIVHNREESGQELDETMRTFELIEAYPLIDFNGDGKAERRKIIMVGDEIFENEEVDSHPFSYLCSEPLTHRFYATSTAELSTDMQEIKTTLFRNILDNIYLMNNQQLAVNKNTVNISDIATRRIGGAIRVNGSPGSEVLPIGASAMPPQAFEMLSYMDKMRQQRTGIDTGETALNPDALKNINIPVARNFFEARTAKSDLMARLFAESGVKQMFLDIHALLRKNQNKEMIIQLRGEPVHVDPREWKERDDMTVAVGLGTGNRDIQLLQTERILERQAQIIQINPESELIDEQKIFNALSREAEAGGMKNPEEFYNNPSKRQEEEEPQEEQPDPNAQFLELQAQLGQKALELQEQQNQISAQKAQVDAQEKEIAAQQKQQEIEFKAQKEAFELRQKEAALELKARELDIREEKGLLDVETARTKLELESNQNVEGAVV